MHLSATAFGGGVAEINYTLVPLMRDAGLDAEWRIIRGADEFFDVTKTIHNALQGDPRGLTPTSSSEIFRRYNAAERARSSTDDYDFVIVHDPQPAAMIELLPGLDARTGSGAATSTSRRRTSEVLDFLLPVARAATTRRSSTCASTCRTPTGCRPRYIWPPAIDPLAPKNMALSPEDAAYIVDQFGIDVERPLLTQVSRFDPWKDPLGVIDAYRVVKEEHPGRAARARRLDGARRPGGLGLSTTRPSRTRPATRTSTSSPTSTTSARSRSTRSRCTRPP